MKLGGKSRERGTERETASENERGREQKERLGGRK